MTYRNERGELLRSAQEAVEGKPVEASYDYFFHYLLLLKHAIITRDVGIIPQMYFSETYGENGSLEDKSIFARAPKTLGGLQEFYNEYFSFVQCYFPQIEQDIEEAIRENKERYGAYKISIALLPNPTPAPVPAVKPSEDGRTFKEINYAKIPPRATFDTFKEYKEAMTEYNSIRGIETNLFRLYLLNFLRRHMAKEFPDINLDKPYPRTDGQERGKRGRGDYLTLRDGLFMLIDKCAGDGSALNSYADREMPYLEKIGLIKKRYSSNAFGSFIRYGDILPILEKMSYESALEMREFERVFAMDGTGFNSEKKGDYYADKHHNGKKEIEWMNCEGLIGVRSGMIVSSVLYFKYETSEIKVCVPMLKCAQDLGYEIEELSADKAYASKELRQTLWDMGIKRYYCEFPSNVKPPVPNDDSVWAEQYREIEEHPDEFYAHYHKRSKIESVFGAIKKRSTENLSSKTLEGYKKEVYGKLIAYNLQCMIRQTFINGIIPDYMTREEILEEARK